jgi:ABC-type nitrate/sulfonate/bicarbonate transport system permease component
VGRSTRRPSDVLILVKFKNAAELLWDSLDTQERMILAYIVGSVLVSVIASASSRSRERLKDELRSEIEESIRGRA